MFAKKNITPRNYRSTYEYYITSEVWDDAMGDFGASFNFKITHKVIKY